MLTPIELQNKELKVGRGYSKKEMDVFLEELYGDFEKLYKQNLELKDKIGVLSEGVQYYKSMETTLQKALVLAEKTAKETCDAAKAKAVNIEKEAEQNALTIQNESKAKIEAMEKECKDKWETILREARIKAEKIEKEAILKAESIQKSAKENAEKRIGNARVEQERITSFTRKEMEETRKKCMVIMQQYNAFKAQFKKLASSQLEMLDGDYLDIYTENLKALLNGNYNSSLMQGVDLHGEGYFHTALDEKNVWDEQIENETNMGMESEAKSNSEIEAEPELELEPVIEKKPESDLEMDSIPDYKMEKEPDFKETVSDYKMEPEIEMVLETEPEVVMENESDLETAAEIISELEYEAEMETEPVILMGTDPEVEMEEEVEESFDSAFRVGYEDVHPKMNSETDVSELEGASGVNFTLIQTDEEEKDESQESVLNANVNFTMEPSSETMEEPSEEMASAVNFTMGPSLEEASGDEDTASAPNNMDASNEEEVSSIEEVRDNRSFNNASPSDLDTLESLLKELRIDLANKEIKAEEEDSFEFLNSDED